MDFKSESKLSEQKQRRNEIARSWERKAILKVVMDANISVNPPPPQRLEE